MDTAKSMTRQSLSRCSTTRSNRIHNYGEAMRIETELKWILWSKRRGVNTKPHRSVEQKLRRFQGSENCRHTGLLSNVENTITILKWTLALPYKLFRKFPADSQRTLLVFISIRKSRSCWNSAP